MGFELSLTVSLVYFVLDMPCSCRVRAKFSKVVRPFGDRTGDSILGDFSRNVGFSPTFCNCFRLIVSFSFGGRALEGAVADNGATGLKTCCGEASYIFQG